MFYRLQPDDDNRQAHADGSSTTYLVLGQKLWEILLARFYEDR